MNSPIEPLLTLDIPLVLASQSPRRRQLLTQLGLQFSVMPAHIDELSMPLSLPPADYVQSLARNKAMAIAESLQEESVLVLGADTIVVIDGEILNKPLHEQDAFCMLKRLSGRTHTVFTGLALIESISKKTIVEVKQTDVRFRELQDDEIHAYIATGSPMDKAGAYGIQEDFGAVFVESISGCYYNVVGLPLEMLYSMLREYSKR